MSLEQHEVPSCPTINYAEINDCTSLVSFTSSSNLYLWRRCFSSRGSLHKSLTGTTVSLLCRAILTMIAIDWWCCLRIQSCLLTLPVKVSPVVELTSCPTRFATKATSGLLGTQSWEGLLVWRLNTSFLHLCVWAYTQCMKAPCYAEHTKAPWFTCSHKRCNCSM